MRETLMSFALASEPSIQLSIIFSSMATDWHEEETPTKYSRYTHKAWCGGTTYCLEVILPFYDEQDRPRCRHVDREKDFNCLLFLILIIWEAICSLNCKADSVVLPLLWQPPPVFLLDSWHREVLLVDGAWCMVRSVCVCLWLGVVDDLCRHVLDSWFQTDKTGQKKCAQVHIIYTYTLTHTQQISGLCAALVCISGGTWSYH